MIFTSWMKPDQNYQNFTDYISKWILKKCVVLWMTFYWANIKEKFLHKGLAMWKAFHANERHKKALVYYSSLIRFKEFALYSSWSRIVSLPVPWGHVTHYKIIIQIF